jgi:hypothetical protein
MNYIVPQNRLKNLMTSFLDDKLVGGVNKIDNFIILYYYDSNDDYYDSEVLMEFDDEDDRLYVDKSFINTFESFFPFGNSQSSIKEWFENTFDVTIEYVES